MHRSKIYFSTLRFSLYCFLCFYSFNFSVKFGTPPPFLVDRQEQKKKIKKKVNLMSENAIFIKRSFTEHFETTKSKTEEEKNKTRS